MSAAPKKRSTRPSPFDDGRGRRPHAISFADPRDVDAVPDGLCRYCGTPGPHANRGACIDALRSLLAMAEGFRPYKPRRKRRRDRWMRAASVQPRQNDTLNSVDKR
jgi:hypothetical protein